MTDIVERLREEDASPTGMRVMLEAADEIEQLREELGVNRTALEMKHAEIERLRAVYESAVQGRRDFRNVYREAEANADNLRAEIERLRAANAKAVEALEEISENGKQLGTRYRMASIARATLKELGGGGD